MSDYPEDLKYSAEHEWVRSGNGLTVRIGITDYAAEQLGDIVFASLPSLGETVAAGDACGELESTKSVSDIFCPVPGVISSVNTLLESIRTVSFVVSEVLKDFWMLASISQRPGP